MSPSRSNGPSTMDDDGRRWRAGEVSKSLVTCSPCPRIEDVTSPWNVRHGSSSTSPLVHCPLLVRAGLRGLTHPRTSWYILPSAASVAFTRRYTAFSAPRGRTVRETTVRETRWVPVRARRVSHTTSLPPFLPPVLSRFRTTSIMSVYSLDRARCL